VREIHRTHNPSRTAVSEAGRDAFHRVPTVAWWRAADQSGRGEVQGLPESGFWFSCDARGWLRRSGIRPYRCGVDRSHPPLVGTRSTASPQSPGGERPTKSVAGKSKGCRRAVSCFRVTRGDGWGAVERVPTGLVVSRRIEGYRLSALRPLHRCVALKAPRSRGSGTIPARAPSDGPARKAPASTSRHTSPLPTPIPLTYPQRR
jgi:hypothetical protein